MIFSDLFVNSWVGGRQASLTTLTQFHWMGLPRQGPSGGSRREALAESRTRSPSARSVEPLCNGGPLTTLAGLTRLRLARTDTPCNGGPLTRLAELTRLRLARVLTKSLTP